MQLREVEPYDYALVTRFFPKSSKKNIEFRFQGERLPLGYAAEVEVQDQRGNRALKLWVDKDWLSFDIEGVSPDPFKINPTDWNHVVLDIDCDNESYTVTLNGQPYPEKKPLNEYIFDESLDLVERIVFRTGPYRNYVSPEKVEYGPASTPGLNSEDLPGSEKKAPLIIFNIDDVITQG